MIGRFLCRLGLHRWDYYGNAYTHAPAPIRCGRAFDRWLAQMIDIDA